MKKTWRRWTKDRDDRLRRCLNRGEAPQATAKRLGVTLNAYYVRRARLGLGERKRRWTAAEDAALVKSKGDPKALAALPGRSQAAARLRLKALGLGPKPKPRLTEKQKSLARRLWAKGSTLR